MSGPLLQNINMARSLDVSAFNSDLVATPFTGAVNDNVLLWQAANQAIGGPPSYTTIANDANLGTAVTLFKAGTYFIELSLAITADVTAFIAGISQDIVASGLTTAIVIGSAGALQATGSITAIDADLGNIALSTYAFVSPEQEAAGSVIRFHAGVAGGGPPTIMLTAATSWYRVRRVGDNNI